MKMPSEKTLVVFRQWRDTGGVIALFPELPSDLYGYFCDSYERVGQHGGADYSGVVFATKPAMPKEYRALRRELTRIGYKLRCIRRASRTIHDNRMKEARRFRER
jgi:hypothetical protein